MNTINYQRRDFLKTLGLGAASMVLAPELSGRQNEQRRPNILLYVVDDQGTNDAGCYDNPAIKTPGLDILAGEGVRFTHAFCTTASCSASRSVILTGMYNHATGQYGHQHAYHHFASFPEIKSLPVLLAQAGYRTFAVGKYHVAPEQVYHFQRYYDSNESPMEKANKCKDFITENDRQPFFLYFCTTEPHRPFLREGSVLIDPNEVIVPSYLPDIPECREELAQYYGSVQRADLGLFQLIDILNETGAWDDTMIIYISDNGIAFPGAKTTLYEPGMRLPCVIRHPYTNKRNIVSEAMITWTDITPTILDFAGALPADHHFQGCSFLSVFEQENPGGWDEIYASHTFHEITMYYPMRAVRGRQFKLIWNIAYGLDYPFASDLWNSKTWQAVLKRGDLYYGKRTVAAYLHRPEFELYDLENDPHEVQNLAGDSKYADILAELKAKLKSFQQRTGDPWIVKWEHE